MVGNVLPMRPTMDDHELVSAIWELLINSEVALHAADIAASLGADSAPVRSTLAGLRQAALVVVTTTAPAPRAYQGCRTLDAMAWARAADLGVHLNLLEKWAHLETRDRRLALQLATEGEVERLREIETAGKKADRHDRRLKKVKSQVAATELGQLVTDARAGLMKERSRKDMDPLTKKALELLEQTIAEGQQALDSLQRNMLRD
jgi:hypothetical protein